MNKNQITLDTWVLEKFQERLNKVLLKSNKIHSPIVLYRRTIEENDTAIEEEIATATEKYVVVQIFAYGGFLPLTFHEQHVFTVDEFPIWIAKRGKNMLLQCLDSIDDILTN